MLEWGDMKLFDFRHSANVCVCMRACVDVGVDMGGGVGVLLCMLMQYYYPNITHILLSC